MRHAITAAVFLVIVGGPRLLAQPWQSYGLMPAQLAAPMPRVPVYRWAHHDHGAALFQDGVQIGYWDHTRQRYCPRDPVTRAWGAWQEEAPVEPPANPWIVKDIASPRNNG